MKTTPARYQIACVAGDDSGPELMEAGLSILDKLMGSRLELVHAEVGYARWLQTQEVAEGFGRRWGGISSETIKSLKDTHAMFYIATASTQFPKGIMGPYLFLVKSFDLFANVRPIRYLPYTGALSPDIDMVLVREQTEGLWGAVEFTLDDSACTLARVTKKGTERIARVAMDFARGRAKRKVTCAHKAQVSKTTFNAFLQVSKQVAEEYPDVIFEGMHTDVVPYVMIRQPADLDVILTTSFAGDILSGVLAAIAGSEGVSPSAVLGDNYGMFRPSHGTAPDIAGKNIINPCATLLALEMMLNWLAHEYSDVECKQAADRLGHAIAAVLTEGSCLTPDLGGHSTTTQMTAEIARRL